MLGTVALISILALSCGGPVVLCHAKNSTKSLTTYLEDFNRALGPDDWSFMVGPIKKYGSRVDEYRAEAVQIKDSVCVIRTVQDPVDRHFTMGYMRSRNSGFQYGEVEWRAKFAKGQGIHSVLRLFSNSPDMLAITFAFDGHALNKLIASVDYPNSASRTGLETAAFVVDGPPGTDYSSGFHVFKIVWERDVVTWWVDGQKVHSMTQLAALFHKPMYVTMFSQVVDSVDATTPLLAEMFVDYVLVRQWVTMFRE